MPSKTMDVYMVLHLNESDCQKLVKILTGRWARIEVNFDDESEEMIVWTYGHDGTEIKTIL